MALVAIAPVLLSSLGPAILLSSTPRPIGSAEDGSMPVGSDGFATDSSAEVFALDVDFAVEGESY